MIFDTSHLIFLFCLDVFLVGYMTLAKFAAVRASSAALDTSAWVLLIPDSGVAQVGTSF